MSEIEQVIWRDNCFATLDGDYLVLTEEEAEKEIRECIENSLCYFSHDFLVYPVFGIKRHTENYDNAKKAVIAICNMYEAANNFLYEVIDNRIGFDKFIKMAVKIDGRGHFIATYDDVEHYCNGYYIYRID